MAAGNNYFQEDMNVHVVHARLKKKKKSNGLIKESMFLNVQNVIAVLRCNNPDILMRQ